MKVEINESVLEDLRTFYQNLFEKNREELTDFKGKVVDREKREAEIQAWIDKLPVRKAEAEKREKQKTFVPSDEYNPHGTWMEKVSHVLRFNGAMSAKSIAGIIIPMEEKYVSNPLKVLRSVSATLSTNSKGKSSMFLKDAQNGDDYLYSINPRYKFKKR